MSERAEVEQVPAFVPWSWVLAHRGTVVLVDVTPEEPRPPAAVSVDIDRDLSGPASQSAGRHPLPQPEAFAAAMRRAGLADDDTVVALDDAGGVMAARLVWMLRATGRRAALLDGPPGAERISRPVAGAKPFSARAWPEDLLAEADDALDPGAVVLDARPRDRYLGAPSELDPRPGHVPGARSLPCRESLDAEGRLLPADELRGRFTSAGVRDERPVVAYCGSGVTACHDLLVLEHLGLGSGRLYVGSWSQYAADPRRPVSLRDEA